MAEPRAQTIYDVFKPAKQRPLRKFLSERWNELWELRMPEMRQMLREHVGLAIWPWGLHGAPPVN